MDRKAGSRHLSLPQTRRVLVVDDVPDVAHMTARFIQEADDDITVVTETSATAGLDRLAETRFDAVISDYDMPGMDGLAFLDEVRSAYPDLPFILFTGRGSEEVASEAISRGVTDYLQKGYGLEQYDLLANTVNNAIERYHAEHELRETIAQFQSLAETAAFALVTMDEESVVCHATPTVKQVFGYEKDELIGESLQKIMPERFHEPHREGVERYLRDGIRRLDWLWLELPGLHADGHEIRLGITFGEIDRDGSRLFTALIRDLSDVSDDDTGQRPR